MKNRDLLFWTAFSARADDLFVVTEPPVVSQCPGLAKTVTVRINLEASAAVLDRRADAYPSQPSIEQIRQGKAEGWLLSGGALIVDHRDRIAVGLRDGNAADRFVYTNVGAGRCDRKLQDHCDEERDSEFILCVKERGTWKQVIFGAQTLPLRQLNKPDVNAILSAIVPGIGVEPAPLVVQRPIVTELSGNIIVEWYDAGGVSLAENLSGHILVDHAVNTTEFRLAMRYDLSAYEDVRIFFGEGTGYAEWLSLEQIRRLVQAENTAQRNFVTSFLRHL